MQTYTGDKIRKLRKEKGLTQKQLGELCGIADSNIRKYESGKQNPKLETLQKIAKALDVPITALRADILPDIRSVSAIVQSSAEVMKNMAENSNQAMSESINEAISAMAAMAKDEKELLSDYHNLNCYGKEEARKRVNELTEIPKYQRKDEQ